jgi:serine/threonine protein kinase
MLHAGPELPVEGTHPESLIGTVLDGKYRLDAYVGECATGWVYAAAHVWIHKNLAIKVLSPERAECAEVVKRLQREALATAQLGHPNVAQANDCGKLDDGSVYLVLEHIEGQALREAIDQAPLQLGRALHITRQVASALGCAHDHGIVHRDIRPDNIVLVQRPRDPDFVKLLDFGLAAMSEDDPSRPSHVTPGPGEPGTRAAVGTPGYMPPEQAQDLLVDARADLYALGVTLYEMVTGVRPFEGSDAEAVLAEQLNKPPLPIAQRLPHVAVPASLDHLMEKLLTAAPEQRLASADELIVALDALLRELWTLHASQRPAANAKTPLASTGETTGGGAPSKENVGEAAAQQELNDAEPSPQTRVSPSLDRMAPASEQSEPGSIPAAQKATTLPRPITVASSAEARDDSVPPDTYAESAPAALESVPEPPTATTASTADAHDAEPITDRRPDLAQLAASAEASQPAPSVPSTEPDRNTATSNAISVPSEPAATPQPANKDTAEGEAAEAIEVDEEESDLDLDVFARRHSSPRASAPPATPTPPSPAVAEQSEPLPSFSDVPGHVRFNGELRRGAAAKSGLRPAACQRATPPPPRLSSGSPTERASFERRSAPPMSRPVTRTAGRPLPRPLAPPLPAPTTSAKPGSEARGWSRSTAAGPPRGIERNRDRRPSRK